MEIEHGSIIEAFQMIASTLGRKADEVRMAMERLFAAGRKPVPSDPNPSRRITTEEKEFPDPGFPRLLGKSIILRVEGWKTLEFGMTVESRRTFDCDMADRTIIAARRMENDAKSRKELRPLKPLKNY